MIPLGIMFAGALFNFLLPRAAYMNFNGILCGGDLSYGAAPGESFSYKGHYMFGIIMHLITIIPAGFLLLFQFVPAIRHHVIIFHRINGYAVVLLAFFSNAGTISELLYISNNSIKLKLTQRLHALFSEVRSVPSCGLVS
jgi:hypothetical protein